MTPTSLLCKQIQEDAHSNASILVILLVIIADIFFECYEFFAVSESFDLKPVIKAPFEKKYDEYQQTYTYKYK